MSLQNSGPHLKDLPKKDAETSGKGSAKKDKGKKDGKEKEVCWFIPKSENRVSRL